MEEGGIGVLQQGRMPCINRCHMQHDGESLQHVFLCWKDLQERTTIF